jgi:hypothetical protein
MLSKRLEIKMGGFDDQFGFRKGKRTIDAIGKRRIISERVLDAKEDRRLCFIDL